jgi:hypothetical protein
MSTHHTNGLRVHAIDPARLNVVRTTGEDAHGNQLRPFAATGQGEPLRCCLGYAEPGEQITLISYAPFERPSVWREVGPVYIHAAPCEGYTPTGRLPEQLATGPRVLRTYRADDTMNACRSRVPTPRWLVVRERGSAAALLVLVHVGSQDWPEPRARLLGGAVARALAGRRLRG